MQLSLTNGPLAQLNRVPAFGSEGCRFESYMDHTFNFYKRKKMEISFIDVLKQLVVAIPIIMVGAQTITAAISGVLNIQSVNVKHWINWIVGTLTGVGFVVFNGLTFVLPAVWMNYVVCAVCGLGAAAASNGVYDWPKVRAVIEAIINLFSSFRTKKA